MMTAWGRRREEERVPERRGGREGGGAMAGGGGAGVGEEGEGGGARAGEGGWVTELTREEERARVGGVDEGEADAGEERSGSEEEGGGARCAQLGFQEVEGRGFCVVTKTGNYPPPTLGIKSERRPWEVMGNCPSTALGFQLSPVIPSFRLREKPEKSCPFGKASSFSKGEIKTEYHTGFYRLC